MFLRNISKLLSNTPEDSAVHRHRCESFKSITIFTGKKLILLRLYASGIEMSAPIMLCFFYLISSDVAPPIGT
jgi:hypothetical protein